MKKLDIYYGIRPFIPRGVQLALRRAIAKRRLAKVGTSWPILESAAEAPSGWPGWPEGRRFAIVLTHDVDSQFGQDQCRRLMDLEEELGFRSCFNLVPERYEVSSQLRAEISDRGFEIGVHGLTHDGRLFKSRRVFEERAARINRYLKEWNSAGFRAPSMMCRLDWMHALDILYDSSTFDTDPFEPLPEGAGTIFPFVVMRGENVPRFIELPYTLPQDFTLFVLLKETSCRIWRTKLDWLASKGGMALLNSHPGYLLPRQSAARDSSLPFHYYREWLEYVAGRYAGKYWHALPRDVARYVSDWDSTRTKHLQEYKA